MMNAKHTLLGLVVLMIQLYSNSTFAQENFVIAGYHDTSMTYYDYKPDVVVQSNSSFNMDLDNSGETDFLLRAYYFSALGGNESSLLFLPQSDNRVVLGRIESVAGYQGIRYKNVAKVQQYGDTINGQLNFVKKPTYLALSSYSEGYQFNITDWFGDGKKYLAFSLVLNDTAVYGWIRVEVTGYDYMKVCEYAFNKKVYLSVNENSEKGLMRLYPNPATDLVSIEINDNKQSELNLIDITGKTVVQKTFYKKTRFDVKGLVKGVYVVQVKTGSEVISRKIIVE